VAAVEVDTALTVEKNETDSVSIIAWTHARGDRRGVGDHLLGRSRQAVAPFGAVLWT